MVPVQEEISHTVKRKKSKHKKKKNQIEDVQSESVIPLPAEEADQSGKQSKKKHKSKKHKAQEEELCVGIQGNKSLEAQPTNTGDNISKSKKKKFKKKILDELSDYAQTETAGNVLSKESKKTNSTETIDIDTHIDKKKRHTDDVTEAAGETKLKNRHKRAHGMADPVDDQITENTETRTKPKKKKKHNKEIDDKATKIEMEQEASTKKKKHKKSKDKDCGDEKSNSLNEAVTDLEIKPQIKASPPTKTPQDNVVQGQWQGSLFDNSDRQNKFLRLMGGMKAANQQNKATVTVSTTKKKGLFGSLVPSPSSSLVSGNAALSASAAADLNQKLEEEYNKAMNFKLTAKKGSGFGFAPDPAEGKKFHIDVFKTKSIQFDD